MNASPRSSEIQNHTRRTRCVLVTSIASLLAANAGFAADAIFSSSAFTGNADSGVSSTKTYTAIANIIGNDVVVNGATFVGSGVALSGTGWNLAGAGSQFGSGGIHQPLGGASIAQLFDGFQYNGNPATVTLSGLTAGQTYVATFYNQAWVLGANRTQNVSSTEGASIVYNEDALAGSVLRYTFVATGATTDLSFLPQIPGNTMHFYGLSNEQVFNNTWSPNSGTSWNTTANWSTGIVPNAAGTNASFSAQAGPTTVSFTSSRRVGHVQFLGTGSYTIEGSTLLLNADVGGTSVLNAEAGGSHTIESLVQLVSDTVKFGAGTITLNNEVFGTKSLSVNGGTLRFGLTNSYTGGTSVGAGATLDLNSTSQPLGTLNGAGTIVNDTAGTSVITVDSGTFSGVIRDHNVGSGIVALTKANTGTLTLTGSHTYTGATTVSGGTLRIRGTETNTTLLSDNFTATGTPNTFDLNFNLENRQTGPLALQSWTPTNNTQVGNDTFVQQPPGTNGNYLLLAFGATASLAGLPLTTTTFPGPVKVSADIFRGSPGDTTDWTSFTIRSTLNGFPIGGSGEFGFLYRNNTGIQAFNNNVLVQDLAATTGGSHFEFYLADADGTGSPFAGNGTKVVVTQGGVMIGGYKLDTGFGPNSIINFGSGGSMIGGVDNLAISDSFAYATNVLLPTTNVNLDTAGATFELVDVYQTVATLAGVAGTAVNIGPFSRLTVDAATNSTFNGAINGMLGSLVKTGPGTLELNATGSLGGGTTISAGTLVTHAPGAIGTSTVAIAAGANFLPWYNTGTPVITNNFTLNGLGGDPGDGNKGAIYADGGGAGHPEYVFLGKVTLAATSDIGGNNLNNQRLLGQVTGPGGLTKGSGRGDENSVLTLVNPANDYDGNTVVRNGTLKLGTADVIPDGAGKGTVILNAGATLDLAGSNEKINNLSGTGTITNLGGILIGAPVFFTTNVESGISTVGKTYTHTVDFGDGSGATVNGVTFESGANAGANWTLTGATFLLPEGAGSGSSPSFPDEPNGTAMNQLLSDFYYNGNPATLTLTGLTDGETYELRLYQRFWGGDRTQLIAFNAGPASASFIHNQDGSSIPNYLSFRYTADASGSAVVSTTQLGAGTYHWYGLTNEVATAPEIPVLTVGDDTDSTYSGAITGELEIDKVGTGELTLNGALDFNTLTVTEGQVNLGDATLDALTIADGATVVLTDSAPPPAPAETVAGGAPQAVPEPGSASLLLLGALGLLGRRRRD